MLLVVFMLSLFVTNIFCLPNYDLNERKAPSSSQKDEDVKFNLSENVEQKRMEIVQNDAGDDDDDDDNDNEDGDEDDDNDSDSGKEDGDEDDDDDSDSVNDSSSSSKKVEREKDKVIQHSGNLCLEYSEKDDIIILGLECQDAFKKTDDNAFKHVVTGKCLWPNKDDQNAELTLKSKCKDENSKFSFTSKGSLKHEKSDKCIHPLGGKAIPSPKTKAVIHTGCDEPRMAFKLKRREELPEMILKHSGGLCIEYDSDKDQATLEKKCEDSFAVKASGRFLHLRSGQCLGPKSRKTDSPIVGLDCDDVESKLEPTKGFSIQHFESGKCLHPKGGSAKPKEGTKVVLHKGCDEKRVEFEIIQKYPIMIKYIQHNDGLYVTYNQEKDKMYLSKKKGDKFGIDKYGGQIRHIKSGKCLTPKATKNNSELRAIACEDMDSKMIVTEENSIKHTESGKCIHPYHGSGKPKEGTKLVIFTGCDEKRLAFNFDDEMEI